MKIKPLGKRVLVELFKSEKKTKSGLFISENVSNEENFGKIIEVSLEITELNVDDYIIFDVNKSMEVISSGEIKYIVNLEDVYAKVEYNG